MSAGRVRVKPLVRATFADTEASAILRFKRITRSLERRGDRFLKDMG